MKLPLVLAALLVPAAVAALGDARRRPVEALQFDNLATASGLATFRHVGGASPDKKYIPEVMSGGVCAADFDRDGWTDVFLVNGGTFATAAGTATPPPHGVFRNAGGGKFVNVTPQSRIVNGGWGMGCVAADYDNDGDPDLYVTNFLTPNQLWRNDGKFRFSDVSAASGSAGPHGRWNAGATFGDYDGDGHLDLFVAGYVHMNPAALPDPATTPDCRHRDLVVNCGPRGLPGENDLLFHNDGNGRFRQVDDPAIDPKHFYGLGAAFLPLDNNGRVSLYVANDSTPNALYRFGPSGLSDVALEAGVALSDQGHEQAGMGIAWGDYDNDSRTDLYVTNFIDDYNTLYRALDGGLYADVTRRTGLAQPAWLYMGWGTAMVDFDHDARLDIIVANGHVYPQVDTLKLPSGWRMPVQVFMNQGGRFGELPRAAVPGMAVGRGLAVGDFWNDGRVGVVINNLDGQPALYKPHAVEGRYIELALEGETIRDATGARVHIRWDGGGTTRLVVSGGSYLSSNDPRVHAGVGSATAVDVEITWPGGQRQTVQRLETNRLHRIRQAAAEK